MNPDLLDAFIKRGLKVQEEIDARIRESRSVMTVEEQIGRAAHFAHEALCWANSAIQSCALEEAKARLRGTVLDLRAVEAELQRLLALIQQTKPGREPA